MAISYTEFNPYWTINVGSTDRNSLIPQSNVWLSLCQFSSLSEFCGYNKFLFKLDKNIENTGKISFMPFNKVCLSPHRFSWDCLTALYGSLQYKFYLDQTNNGTMWADIIYALKYDRHYADLHELYNWFSCWYQVTDRQWLWSPR